GAVTAADHHRPQVWRQVHLPAVLRNGGRQLLRYRLQGRRAPTPRVVSQYSREPRRRSTSRDEEDKRAGQDNGGRGTPPTLEKGARILATLRRLPAQDRARDPGGRAGSSSLGHDPEGCEAVFPRGKRVAFRA